MASLCKLAGSVIVLVGLSLGLPTSALAHNGRWVREFYGHYFTVQDARMVAGDLNRSGRSDFRNATYDTSPNPTTGTYGVYVERFYPEQAPAASTVSGQLTRSDPFDRIRQGHHAKVYTVRLTPGRSYTIELNSVRGAGSFDTWLRIEDSRGNVLANDDDSGAGLNSRIVFTPTREDNFRLVVTSYSRGATGGFTLIVR